MIKQYFYIGKKEAIKHQSMVYAVSDDRIENYIDLFGDNAIEFFGENLPFYPTVVDDSFVREATNFELYVAGIYAIKDDEFVNNGTIDNINNYEKPYWYIKPVFDYNLLCWIDIATDDEKKEHEWNQAVSFYNDELIFASKATAELACEIISQEMYEDVKAYMKAIDPYAQQPMTKLNLERPPVFDRYKNK